MKHLCKRVQGSYVNTAAFPGMVLVQQAGSDWYYLNDKIDAFVADFSFSTDWLYTGF